MKLVIILSVIFMQQVYAGANAQTITLSCQKVSMKNIFIEINRQTGYEFLYNSQMIEKASPVSVNLEKATLSEALETCFKGQPFSYTVEGKTIVVTPMVKVQDINVRGKVTDKEGNPLPGVNVIIKSTMKGAVTDTDGKYTIEVPENSTLIFSFMGYTRKEIAVNSRREINVTLLEEIAELKELTFNAGYYTVKEKERTGSISKVSAREIENQPVSNVLSAVQGRMAGVNITQSSGVPGSGFNVQIRGTNSLRRAGNFPMYIIDGVPVSSETPSINSGAIIPYAEINLLNSINPNDIESIEILKDADATAIYGSRGANGVILITTKKGKASPKINFSINTYYGLSRIANTMELMNTNQYLEMRFNTYAKDGITNYPANAYDINGTWDQTRYTDWQKELIGGTASNSSTQLSVRGGTENSSFLISASHNEQTTVFAKDFRYKTNNLSGSLTHHSNDKKFSINVSGLFSAQTNNLIATDITSSSLKLSPNAPALYGEEGSLNWENNTFSNPVAAYKSTYNYDSKTFNTNLNLNYELFPSFYVKLNGGINYQAFDEINLTPNTIYNPAYGITTENSQASKAIQQQFSYLFEPQLNYRHKFNTHEIDILIGGTYQQRKTTSFNIFSYGFDSNTLITNLSAAENIIVYGNDVSNYKYAAFFGRINYQYKGRYILNLTGRRDGSSRFGPDNRFANFGAIGVSWLFSEEGFLADKQWLSFGKLRASYGITGSDLIGDYQWLDTYTVSSSSSYTGGSSLYPSRLSNPYFSWEKTTKLEVALEAGLLKDRINFNAAWYRNKSSNQLVGIPLPGTTGFSSIQANLPATVENNGWELDLSTVPVQTGQFHWNSNFNISFPRNKLVAFPGLEGSTYANTYVVGYPLSIKKVYNYEGIDSETGLYKFTDYNEDGKISSPEDNKIIEKVGIKYFGGWSNDISYKQLNFSFLFQFVKQTNINYNNLMSTPGSMNNQPVELLDVWSEDNPNGHYMPYTTNSQKNKLTNYFKSSTASISDASYIRLKNIQLSYNIKVNKYLQDILIYVQGQNLWTVTNYFGVDPEFTLTNYLPPLKTWSFGIQLNF
ncbi:MAG: SusC/RagA family TonB-linked outer membrane protein [Bacteroidales bacterium]|nr:SusC/RagA family TonB-linked outer membrane protein [Bacteroidales bacterium]MDD3990135.1 SusC/RagA family TonB-linked outer membrane protein [Bacteroidales bacterium]